MDMYEDRSFRTNFVVGFLTLALVVGLAVVVTFFLSKESPLATTYPIAVRFADVGGLKVGAPVTLMGAGIGRVEALALTPQGATRTAWLVRLAIRDEPWIRERLTTETTFTVQPESVFGNKYVNATFGDGGKPLEPGAQVQGSVISGIDASMFTKLEQTLENTSEATKVLKEALSTDNQTKMKQTFDDLSKSAANLANVTERMKTGMDSWAETMEKLRFWRGWFGDGDKKNGERKPQ